MKTLFATLTVAVFSLDLSAGAFAADLPARAPAAPATPAVPEKTAGESRSLPMYSRVDSIDLKARVLTTKRKDGKEVKSVITPATEIRQGPAPARLEDIKAGDYVSGSRKKVSDTEYTVVKITKFGPKAEKADEAPKGTEKPAERKAN